MRCSALYWKYTSQSLKGQSLTSDVIGKVFAVLSLTFYKYSTDYPVLLDEADDWYGECVIDIPDIPKPLHKWDYDIDYNSKDRSYIGEIKLRYNSEEEK